MESFDGIKKVISIWLCMTSPAHKESGITEYNFLERTLVGKISNETQKYDLIQIVMVYIGSSAQGIENELLKLLHLIFRATMKATEKTERLQSDFDITLDDSMTKELNIMCNLSEGIAEEARDAAWKEAREQLTLSHIRSLIKNMKMSAEQAMDALGVPVTDRSKYANLIG